MIIRSRSQVDTLKNMLKEKIQHLTSNGSPLTSDLDEILRGSNDAFDVCIIETDDTEFGIFYTVYILGKNNTFESEEWGGCEFDSLDEAEEEVDRLLSSYDSDVISVRKVLNKERYKKI